VLTHPTILHVQSLETKRRENNEKRNIDLAILPSHDNSLQSLANLLSYPSWYLGDTVGKSS